MSELFGRHDPGPGHPERPERYAAVAAAVRAAGAPVREAPPAPADALERVHAPAYLEPLERFCTAGGGALDPDTVVTGVSWRAAIRGAGGAMAAVDAVAADPSRSAFSFGRPPGHHAEAARAMGFCIVNSAAVAAAHARHTLGMDRVAVLDWDAHHGNGTQAIFYEDPTVLYVSLHQHPFYPGTGTAAERGAGDGVGATVNLPLPAGTGEDAFLEAFRAHALPAIERFGPDLAIVSAGFDAHRDDPLCSLGVTADGFGTMASELRERFGGLALVLEGGYDLGALESGVGAVLTALAA
ncbi:MAG TPA: histone deacetylase [Gaiellales bacterium]|jgi:acetoin utilization deacetylase AcuC-like enzyme